MKQLAKYFLFLVTPLLLSLFNLAPVHAEAVAPVAPPATLTVKVTIDQPELFWNYTLLTKDDDLGKPTAVKLTWGTGDSHRQESTDIIVNSGKKAGQLSITTPKGILVNLQIIVCDAKNIKYGSMSFQLRNNGQTQDVTVAPPLSAEPQINLGTGTGLN
jgi:hypothetical protein